MRARGKEKYTDKEGQQAEEGNDKVRGLSDQAHMWADIKAEAKETIQERKGGVLERATEGGLGVETGGGGRQRR